MVNKITKLLLLPLCAAAVLGAAVGCGGTSSSSGDEFEQESNNGEGFTMWVVGSDWNSWTPSTVGDAQAFKKQADGTFKYTVTISKERNEKVSKGEDDKYNADYVGFKFIAAKSWDSQFGMEDVDYDNCNDAFKKLVKDVYDVKDYTEYKAKWHEGTSNRNNLSFQKLTIDEEGNVTDALGAGSYEIVYNPANFFSLEENDTTYLHKFVVNYTAA